MTSVVVESPPVQYLGGITSQMENDLGCVARDVENDPGFTEAGRMSRRVSFDDQHTGPLHEMAACVCEHFLGVLPTGNSTALLSVVTDESLYRKYTREFKVASNWHQDFITDERGYFFAPSTRTRLIITTMVGPVCVEGTVQLDDAVQIPYVCEGAPVPSKSEALARGLTVIGADGVLMKSEVDLSGVRIYDAAPNNAFILPNTTAHHTHPDIPDGRIFFQVDLDMV